MGNLNVEGSPTAKRCTQRQRGQHRFDPIFLAQSILQDVKLQSSHRRDKRLQFAEAPQNLHRPFLSHLHHALIERLSFPHIGRMDASEHFRLKLGQRLKVKSIGHRNRIADCKGARINDADDVAGIGDIHRAPLLRDSGCAAARGALPSPTDGA